MTNGSFVPFAKVMTCSTGRLEYPNCAYTCVYTYTCTCTRTVYTMFTLGSIKRKIGKGVSVSNNIVIIIFFWLAHAMKTKCSENLTDKQLLNATNLHTVSTWLARSIDCTTGMVAQSLNLTLLHRPCIKVNCKTHASTYMYTSMHVLALLT